ncbi:MAG: nucleoside hydrolase [Eubacteriales bacterium]|nr:nucleoside hydrolase [Eubacteriales bacterium]
MKILLDVDTGVDDAFSILYAALKPQYEIVGITTVCGNVESSLAAENTLKILDLVDAPDIPVVVGASAPLSGRWEGRVRTIHGDNGIGNAELPKSRRKLHEEDAADFHIRLAQQYEGEIVLVTLGPLTNVALTLKKYPDFAKKIKKMIMMGGTISARGNVSPVGEANVVCDPEACDAVFLSGMDITAVGLDVTMQVRLKREHMDWLTENCSPRAKKAVSFLNKALQHYWHGNQVQNYCIGDCPVHDPLAVMCAGTPGLVRTQVRRARVECGGTYCRGMIVTDLREHPIAGGDIRFALEVDANRALRELLSPFWEIL